MINETLREYIQSAILPMYDGFDAAHQRDHVDMVINQSMEIASRLKANPAYEAIDMDMVYAIAAYHDTGLVKDRATHHLESGRILRSDSRLTEWFGPERIEMMAQAVEDHRASTP